MGYQGIASPSTWSWCVCFRAWSVIRVQSPHRRQTCGQCDGTYQCPRSGSVLRCQLVARAHYWLPTRVHVRRCVLRGTAHPPEVVCITIVGLVGSERHLFVGAGRGVGVADLQSRSHLVRTVDCDAILDIICWCLFVCFFLCLFLCV